MQKRRRNVKHFICALHPLYSTYVLDSPHVQLLSRSSLVFPLVLNPQLHAPYISSPSANLISTLSVQKKHAHNLTLAIPILCQKGVQGHTAVICGISTT